MAEDIKGLTFGEPPARDTSKRRGVDWFGVAEALRDNPGKWAKVDSPLSLNTARTRISHIRNSKARGFEVGAWDARIEPTTSGKEKGEWAYVWILCKSPDDRDATDVTVAPEPQAEPEESVPFE